MCVGAKELSFYKSIGKRDVVFFIYHRLVNQEQIDLKKDF